MHIPSIFDQVLLIWSLASCSAYFGFPVEVRSQKGQTLLLFRNGRKGLENPLTVSLMGSDAVMLFDVAGGALEIENYAPYKGDGRLRWSVADL